MSPDLAHREPSANLSRGQEPPCLLLGAPGVNGDSRRQVLPPNFWPGRQPDGDVEQRL